MYWLQYVQYFAYIAWHWNVSLAWFVLKHEIQGEKKYKVRTTGINELRTQLKLADWQHASIYQPINFYTAEKLFAKIPLSFRQGAFLDTGCGKGRVLAMAAHHGFTTIYGIDLAPALCAEARALATQLVQKFNLSHIEVTCCNASQFEVPPATSVIFLFNPFDATVMEPFITRVLESIAASKRQLLVLYANPVHKKLWMEAGFDEIYYFKKMTYLEGSVLQYALA
ncbi:MAG TPA: class I SAM-dependent methyltransferase [Phnomibacter sp.]|nr:class I SAM-dependent methyltransferase [Phnomibacter sp.]